MEYILQAQWKPLTKAVKGFIFIPIMWRLNGLEAIQSEIKKITKIKNKMTLLSTFLYGSGQETSNFFYLAEFSSYFVPCCFVVWEQLTINDRITV